MKLTEAVQFITEIFDDPVEFERQDQGNKYLFFADINEKELKLIAEKIGFDNWEVYFGVDGEVDITRTGDEIVVFSTVIEMVRDFLISEKPNSFRFTSKSSESSRTRLYKRMVQNLSAKSRYSLDFIDDDGDEVMFLMKRD